MKRSRFILLVTLSLNVLLAIACFIKLHTLPHRTAAASISVPTPDPLLAALASGDPAALRAAGVSEEVIRRLALGHAVTRLNQQLRAVKPEPATEPRYWHNAAWLRDPYSRAQHAELNAARSEFADTLCALLGEDVSSDPLRDSQRAFLSAVKQEKLARIERDYAELNAEISRDAGSLRLASDLEKLNFLRTEKERDIASLLSPAEREMLDLRESPSAQNVRARFGEALADEADYRTVVALQKSFDEKYPISTGPSRTRLDAAPELEEKIRAALGDDKFNALALLTDQDRRELSSLDRRLSLPDGTVNRALEARDALALESQRIYHDASLSPEDRDAQIKQLGARARAELTSTLGVTAAAAYAPAAAWLRYLDQGWAFSTDPKAAPPHVPTLGFAAFPLLRSSAPPQTAASPPTAP